MQAVRPSEGQDKEECLAVKVCNQQHEHLHQTLHWQVVQGVCVQLCHVVQNYQDAGDMLAR